MGKANRRLRKPAWYTRSRLRLVGGDVAWAGVSPLIAYLLRDASLPASISRLETIAVYCAIAVICSSIIFQWFRTREPITRFFSAFDAVQLLKPCILTAALTAALAFLLTRLDEVPRSIPVLHLILLTSGLLTARMVARLRATERESRSQRATRSPQHILIIGASRLAWFFSRMVEELAPGEYQIVALLDERANMQHRSLNGHPIVGSPADLEKIMDAYKAHGVAIDKVVLAAEPGELSRAVQDEVSRVCLTLNIDLEILPERLLAGWHARPITAARESQMFTPVTRSQLLHLDRSFWKAKRVIDFMVALTAATLLSPVILAVLGVVLIDVGVPGVFWQRRLGQNGAPLFLYKFRTLQTLFDPQTHERREARSPSSIGRFLRASRLDELPQIWNVLSGDMSLIGPRPLLPIDQPEDSAIRLSARPGLTGWAQICGGKLISAEEKTALDEWYIRHASLRLDVLIVLRTIYVLIAGDRRDETAISAALLEKTQGQIQIPDSSDRVVVLHQARAG